MSEADTAKRTREPREALTPPEQQRAAPSTSRPQRENWKTWVGPMPEAELMEIASPLLTRADLLERLNEHGLRVTARDLAYWQSKGVTPYPTKRREGTATIAVYPSWMFDLIRTLRRSQQANISLTEIGLMLRDEVARIHGHPLDQGMKAFLKQRTAIRERDNHLQSLLSPLANVARDIETIGSIKIGRIEVIFHREPDDSESHAFNVHAAWPPVAYRFEDGQSAPTPVSSWDPEEQFTDWIAKE